MSEREFDCEGCGVHVHEFGWSRSTSGFCALCAWLCEAIPDPVEMMRLRAWLRETEEMDRTG